MKNLLWFYQMPPPPPASHTDPSPWILPLVMSSLVAVQVEKGTVKMMVSVCYHDKTGVTLGQKKVLITRKWS